MKTTKRTLTALAMVALLAPAIESCKKGEEDPAISMRTRDSRATGTWTLKTKEYSYTTNTVTTTTNTVNTDKTVSTTDVKDTETFDGSTRTRTNSAVTKSDFTYDSKCTGCENETVYSQPFTGSTMGIDLNSSDIDAYTVKVQLFKDNTYTATYTNVNKSDETWGVDADNGAKEDADTEIAQTNSNEWTEEGSWLWLDSKKNKIEIMAGPLAGKILRLANDELIIEDMGTETSSNTSSESKYGTSGIDREFQTYDTANPMKKGSLNTTTTTTTTWSNTQTWEKLDNEDERAGK